MHYRLAKELFMKTNKRSLLSRLFVVGLLMGLVASTAGCPGYYGRPHRPYYSHHRGHYR